MIALGAGAFFTGFLLYILKLDELRAVINSAVVIGFVCYSGAVAVLVVDVGQPLRSWFTFWYPNVHSMLTEVTFCISCYLTVLLIEYLPIVLRNRKLREVPSFLVFEHELHKLVYVLAGVGTFLSFFHQGSLGGLYGVLRGRPFAFREGLGGLALHVLPLHSFGGGGGTELHSADHLDWWRRSPASGWCGPRCYRLLGAHFRTAAGGLRAGQELSTRWSGSTALRPGPVSWRAQYYSWKPFGTWILFAEIGVFGLVPALILLTPRLRARTGWLVTRGRPWPACGVALNRFVMTVQTLALPTLSFDPLHVLLRRAGRRSGRSWRWWRMACWSIRSRSATSTCSRKSAN